MAQARTHRDQGSLSGLVYSQLLSCSCILPGSCANRRPLFFLHCFQPPCTSACIPSSLLASLSLHFWKPPCTSGNLPEGLTNSLCSHPPCTPPNFPNSLHLSPSVPLSTFTVVAYFPIPFFLLPGIISPSPFTPSAPFLPHLPSAFLPPLRILSSSLLPPFSLQKLQHVGQAGGGERYQGRAPQPGFRLFSAGPTQVLTPPGRLWVAELASQALSGDLCRVSCTVASSVLNTHLRGGRGVAVDPLRSARVDLPHLGFLTRSASFLKASGLGSFTCFVAKEPRNRSKAPRCRERMRGGKLYNYFPRGRERFVARDSPLGRRGPSYDAVWSWRVLFS